MKQYVIVSRKCGEKKEKKRSEKCGCGALFVHEKGDGHGCRKVLEKVLTVIEPLKTGLLA